MSIRVVPHVATLRYAVAGVLTLAAASCGSDSAGPQSECSFSATTIVTPAGADAGGVDLAAAAQVRVFFETPYSLCTITELQQIRVSADSDVHEVASAAAVSESVARKVTFPGPVYHSIVTASVDVQAVDVGETTVRLTFTHPTLDPPVQKSFVVRVQ